MVNIDAKKQAIITARLGFALTQTGTIQNQAFPNTGIVRVPTLQP